MTGLPSYITFNATRIFLTGTRDAAAFLMTDYLCDNRALIEEFKVTLTPPRSGMKYLASGR